MEEDFRRDSKTLATVTSTSIVDNLPMKIEQPEINIEESRANVKIKQRRDRPPKINVQQSVVYGSDKSTLDGQWMRKDESDVGDGVKVKAKCKPEFQGCDADRELYSENLVTIKSEPIDDCVDNATENMQYFGDKSNNRSTLNIKEEPIEIFHENVSQDFSNNKTTELLHTEELDSNIVKQEVGGENEWDRQLKENFIKCESAFDKIISTNEENYFTNDPEKPMEKRHHCLHCEKTYKNKCHLSRHMKYECLVTVLVNRPKYKCSDCHVHFKTKYTMERHYASKHLKEGERTSCDACHKTFRDEKTLKRHLARYCCNGIPTTSFTCKKCNKEYRHSTSIWRHMTYECEKVPRFGCAHCDYMTLQKGNIVKHFRRKHADEEEQIKYDCPKCKKIYKNEFTLKRHVNFECNKEPAFSCVLCQFKTKRKFSLQLHIKHRHKS